MSVQPYTPTNGSTSASPDVTWPNRKSALYLVTLLGNITCYMKQVPMPVVRWINLPVRVLHIGTDIQERSYVGAAFRLSAFALLFFPQGLLASMTMDSLAEIHNMRHSRSTQVPIKRDETSSNSSSPSRPMDERTARGLFHLKDEDSFTEEELREKYRKLHQDFESRKSRVSPFLAARVAQLLAQVDSAYELLSKRVS